MSFRRQLFFSLAVLVVVPALIAAVSIGRVVASNQNAKADAQLQGAARVADVIEETYLRRAARRAGDLREDRAFRAALATGRPSRIRAALPGALRRANLLSARAQLPGGEVITVGRVPAVGVTQVRAPLRAGSSRVVVLTFAVATPAGYVREVAETTGVPVALVGEGGRTLAIADEYPTADQVDLRQAPAVAKGRWRIVGQPVATLGAATSAQAVFAVEPRTATSPVGLRVVLGVLIVFVLVGVGLGLVLLRALARRIQQFLSAAEKLGAGDFSAAADIPARGNDEFSKLGRAFVGMARQLDQRVDQLERERGRVQSSLLRLGKAFAANLDRNTLVDLVVESAVDGLTADAGRALLPTGPSDAPEMRGAYGAVLDAWDALGAVERAVLATGRSAAIEVADLHAIGEPLRTERGDGPIGVISVARPRPFDASERELLTYLTEQAAVSLANVERHEDVARESITDTLTGLANRRRFDDVLAMAASRATDASPIALVMLDLDRFKVINDTHGHPFGDTVLRTVAHVVSETARERDLPARYGGEELAVVLATGDAQAAAGFAERLRERIESLRFGDESTGPVRVTASLGVASLPQHGETVGDLVRAADEALYRAKRGGRNRVEVATSPQGPAGEVG